MLIDAIQLFAVLGATSWLIADLLAWRSERMRAIRAVLRPPYLWWFCPFLVVTNLREGLQGDEFGPVVAAVWAVNWVIAYRSRHDDDDDDFWKKRRKKLAARVKELAGKLVVVPEPAASR